jgi:hypothetical protein
MRILLGDGLNRLQHNLSCRAGSEVAPADFRYGNINMGTLTSVLSLTTEGESALRQSENGVRMTDGAKIKSLSIDEGRGWVRVTNVLFLNT